MQTLKKVEIKINWEYAKCFSATIKKIFCVQDIYLFE